MGRHTIADLAAMDPDDLQDDLRPLGLWRRRSLSTVRLARAWLERPPGCAADVLRMPGCGKYASDSWAIFVDGRTDVDPHDGKLVWYLMRLKERHDDDPD
jgi:endonuclease III